ncbi:MAG: hypothetical protein KDB44_02495, partial [Mycobacterium sp.]|nr:hypothetical protein [Mycobacterium sp.]
MPTSASAAATCGSAAATSSSPARRLFWVSLVTETGTSGCDAPQIEADPIPLVTCGKPPAECLLPDGATPGLIRGLSAERLKSLKDPGSSPEWRGGGVFRRVCPANMCGAEPASMTDTVTRFAPSPTGLLHLGHAYSA